MQTYYDVAYTMLREKDGDNKLQLYKVVATRSLTQITCDGELSTQRNNFWQWLDGKRHTMATNFLDLNMFRSNKHMMIVIFGSDD